MLWDDDAHVTKPALQSLRGLERIWLEPGATQQYYPLLHTAFWVEHRLWGDATIGYHLINCCWHALAAWLLWRILRRLSFPAPTLAALLFALHPVMVESVAWIAEQKNTLSAVFYLGSALAYLGFDATRHAGRYRMASLLFVAALLTKSVTATLPAALLLVLWWRRGRLKPRDCIPLVPWFALAVAAGAFTAWVERRYIGARGPQFDLGFPQRLALSGRVIWFYLGKLIWPHPLVFIYPRWAIGAPSWRAFLPLAAVVVAILGLAALARRTRGPLCAFLFFAGTLFPVLGFVNVYPFLFSYVADHFQYLAAIGLLVGAAWLLERIAAAPWSWIVPAALAILSCRQSFDYRNAETLYRSTLARNSGAWLAHYNLGVVLEHEGRLEEAIPEYRATLRLNPGHWSARANLATALMQTGRPAEAVAEYEAALRTHRNFPSAENDLGLALERLPGEEAEAEAHLRRAIELNPDYADAYDNLGILLLRGGRRSEAIPEFARAIQRSPQVPEYHYELANALSDEPGRLSDAAREYRRAIELDPGYVEAHGNLAVALARLGDLRGAIREMELVVRLRPGLSAARAYIERWKAALSRTP